MRRIKKARGTRKRKEKRKENRVNRITIIGSKSKSQLWLSARAIFASLLAPSAAAAASIYSFHNLYIYIHTRIQCANVFTIARRTRRWGSSVCSRTSFAKHVCIQHSHSRRTTRTHKHRNWRLETGTPDPFRPTPVPRDSKP